MGTSKGRLPHRHKSKLIRHSASRVKSMAPFHVPSRLQHYERREGQQKQRLISCGAEALQSCNCGSWNRHTDPRATNLRSIQKPTMLINLRLDASPLGSEDPTSGMSQPFLTLAKQWSGVFTKKLLPQQQARCDVKNDSKNPRSLSTVGVAAEWTRTCMVFLLAK